MAINNYTEQNLADVLHKGMLDGVRKNLNQQLMNNLEKEVDIAIDETLRQMKGYVESYRNIVSNNIIFNVHINGVHKCLSPPLHQ